MINDIIKEIRDTYNDQENIPSPINVDVSVEEYHRHRYKSFSMTVSRCSQYMDSLDLSIPHFQVRSILVRIHPNLSLPENNYKIHWPKKEIDYIKYYELVTARLP